MAIINSYPPGTPKTNDLIAGTSIPAVNTNDDPKTVNFSVGSILALGPDILTSKTTITTEQLKVSGVSPVNIVDLADNQVADVISVIIKVNNQSAANKLTFANPLTIEPSSINSINYRYIIPEIVANSEVADEFYKPVLSPGYSSIGPVVGDVRFKNFTSGSNPVETGTAITTIDIYITYRVIQTS